jgi:hypothetical protein
VGGGPWGSYARGCAESVLAGKRHQAGSLHPERLGAGDTVLRRDLGGEVGGARGARPVGGRGRSGGRAPPGSQMLGTGSRSCARARAARGAAGLPSRCLASFRAPGIRLSTWRPSLDGALTRGHQGRIHGASHEDGSGEDGGPRQSPLSHRRVPSPASAGHRVPGSGRRCSSGGGGRIECRGSASARAVYPAPPRPHPCPTHLCSAPPFSAAPQAPPYGSAP